MPITKSHKRRKSSRMHGRGMGSHGWGFRKKHKKKGHKGGKGMSGTGKRADQKKTLILKLYGHDYFGKQGITSKGTERDKRDRINISMIESNIESYIKNGIAKKSGDKFEINLSTYKILGEGIVKNKLVITAKEASKSAIEKINKAGGEIILGNKHKTNKEKDNKQIQVIKKSVEKNVLKNKKEKK